MFKFAPMGQGSFHWRLILRKVYQLEKYQLRKDVLELWGGKCPITGVNMKQILIASHIVPWYLSDNREKIDKYNGFPLSPVYDKLFDLGYISFNDDGKMIFSPHLSEETMERLKINKQHNIAGLKEEHLRYLKKHREIYGFL